MIEGYCLLEAFANQAVSSSLDNSIYLSNLSNLIIWSFWSEFQLYLYQQIYFTSKTAATTEN